MIASITLYNVTVKKHADKGKDENIQKTEKM